MDQGARILLGMLLCAATCGLSAQDEVIRSAWAPGFHPYIEPTFFSGGGGMNAGFVGAGGLEYEARHFAVETSASYGFVRKVNDNDQVPDEHGHTRRAEGLAYWRLRDYFVGAGASWGETAVTPYRKYSWAPEISGGRRWVHNDQEFRIDASYFRARREYTDFPTSVQFTPGPGQPRSAAYCICSNGVSGYDLQVWHAPGESGHMLFHYDLRIIRFHTTVTDPYNLPMTAEQSGQHGTGAEGTVGVQFRF